ncbi:HD family phosphohydrolase [Clostridia bacterium]|nr:HD family phosphohydrolase [Clostridia bacterium]
MRFVPVNCIREGAKLGKTLLGVNGEVLLKANTELKKTYIKRILTMGVQGVYISDELSEDIEVQNIISSELRMSAVKRVRTVFNQVSTESPKKGDSQHVAEALEMIDNIVDEILSNASTMVNVVDIKVFDEYTFYHCLNVTVMSVVLGMGLGFSREKLCKLAYGALLHDVGKVFVDKDILDKNAILSGEELTHVRRHPVEGYLYLRERYHMAEISARGVLEHHERFDGSGYPKKRVGKEISEFGRIIAVADVYDALTSDRPYRRALFTTEATEYILGGSGRMFDPEVVEVFSRKFAPFPAGTVVMLSNGSTALVMRNVEGHSQRPVVRVFAHEDRGAVKPYVIDLSQDRDALGITIVATVAM